VASPIFESVKDVTTPSNLRNEDYEDESPRLRTTSTEADIKQAVMNMHETQDVLQVVKEFEKCFCSAKSKINECDVISLESDLMIQALKMQYKIV
jgi:hypothetical protein